MTNIYVEHGGIGLKMKIVASLIQSYNGSYPYWPLWPWKTYSLQLSIFLFVIMVLRHLWKDQKAIRTCLKAQSIRNKVGKLFHGSFQLNWFIFDLKSLHLIFKIAYNSIYALLLFFFQLHPAEHRLLGSFRRPRPLVIEDRLKTCKTLLLPNNGGASDQAGWLWSEMLAPAKTPDIEMQAIGVLAIWEMW